MALHIQGPVCLAYRAKFNESYSDPLLKCTSTRARITHFIFHKFTILIAPYNFNKPINNKRMLFFACGEKNNDNFAITHQDDCAIN